MRNLSRDMELKKKELKGKFRTETVHIRNEKFRRQALSKINSMEKKIIELRKDNSYPK